MRHGEQHANKMTVMVTVYEYMKERSGQMERENTEFFK
jgi:hypothetical protein